MNSKRRRAPVLSFFLCMILLVALVERQHYSADASMTFEIFGSIVLAFVFLRNYTPPAIFSGNLPRLVGIVIASALALAVAFLTVAIALRIWQ